MNIPDYSGRLLRAPRVFENILVRKISNAPFLPLSLTEVAKHCSWDLAEDPTAGQVTEQDDVLTMVIGAVRDWWEHHTGMVILRAVMEQTQDAVKKDCVSLRVGPVLSVTSVKTIAGFTAATSTPVTLSSTLYSLVGNDVYSDEWPAHRGKGSVIVRYAAGLVDWVADDVSAPDAAEIAAAQALVPYNHKLAMLNTIGHLLENREGSKTASKYEVDAKLAGLTPPNSELLAVGVSNLSLLGKCWR